MGNYIIETRLNQLVQKKQTLLKMKKSERNGELAEVNETIERLKRWLVELGDDRAKNFNFISRMERSIPSHVGFMDKNGVIEGSMKEIDFVQGNRMYHSKIRPFDRKEMTEAIKKMMKEQKELTALKEREQLDWRTPAKTLNNTTIENDEKIQFNWTDRAKNIIDYLGFNNNKPIYVSELPPTENQKLSGLYLKVQEVMSKKQWEPFQLIERQSEVKCEKPADFYNPELTEDIEKMAMFKVDSNSVIHSEIEEIMKRRNFKEINRLGKPLDEGDVAFVYNQRIFVCRVRQDEKHHSSFEFDEGNVIPDELDWEALKRNYSDKTKLESGHSVQEWIDEAQGHFKYQENKKTSNNFINRMQKKDTSIWLSPMNQIKEISKNLYGLIVPKEESYKYSSIGSVFHLNKNYEVIGTMSEVGLLDFDCEEYVKSLKHSTPNNCYIRYFDYIKQTMTFKTKEQSFMTLIYQMAIRVREEEVLLLLEKYE